MSDEKKNNNRKKAEISGRLDDVFAKKNAPFLPRTGSTARAVDFDAKENKKLPTSVKLPVYVDAQIKPWLDKNPDHNLGTMFLFALKSIGFDVRAEDLVPQRLRRTR